MTTKDSTGLIHAGAGAGLFLVQLSALIPGLLPFVALLALFAFVLVAPLVMLGVAAAVLAAPLAGLWVLVRRDRA